MDRLARIHSAAADLLALPPGGWGETTQAWDRLRDEIFVARRVYSLPGGGATASESAAVMAWLDESRKRGCRVHPDRQ